MSSVSPASQRPSADFWKFWAGQTISNLGSSFTEFALPLLIFKLTGSALNLAIYWVALYLGAPTTVAFVLGTGLTAIFSFIRYRALLHKPS